MQEVSGKEMHVCFMFQKVQTWADSKRSLIFQRAGVSILVLSAQLMGTWVEAACTEARLMLHPVRTRKDKYFTKYESTYYSDTVIRCFNVGAQMAHRLRRFSCVKTSKGTQFPCSACSDETRGIRGENRCCIIVL